ncbi:MAG TPA: hypothetical protein VIE89_12885 [Candidatus Binatia bacterium]
MEDGCDIHTVQELLGHRNAHHYDLHKCIEPKRQRNK